MTEDKETFEIFFLKIKILRWKFQNQKIIQQICIEAGLVLNINKYINISSFFAGQKCV
jgi:hypothetical protein